MINVNNNKNKNIHYSVQFKKSSTKDGKEHCLTINANS